MTIDLIDQGSDDIGGLREARARLGVDLVDLARGDLPEGANVGDQVVIRANALAKE